MNFDENNIATGKLRYQGTLDVSLYSIYQNENMKYKARINSNVGLPKAVYMIINVISIIQLIGPCFFVNSTYLWDQDSILTQFMKSIGCIWQLWTGKSNVIAGLSFSILIFVYELGFGVWSCVISKDQNLKKGEHYFALLSGKYLRPIFTILAYSSLPTSIYRIKTDKLISVLNITLLAIITIITPFDLYLISARILAENNPNHEWNQMYPFLSFLVTLLLVLLSSSVDFVNKTIQAVLMALCVVVYALFAAYIFIVAPTIKRSFSLITCSFSISGCLVSIFSIIFLFAINANSAILIFLFVIFFVISYIVLTFVNKRKTSKIMMIFSQCESNPNDAEFILKSNFKSASSFIHAVHLSFQYFPPFLLSWKPFTIFNQEYYGNTDIILLWIRICALFPQEAEQFRYLVNQYANLKHDHFIRTSLLTQMVIIQSFRNLDLTPAIMKSISSISKHIEIANILQFKFWERMLQKSTEVFWPNIRSISKLVKRIDNDILHLLKSYPNDKDIVAFYCKFLQSVKCDYINYKKWSDNLKQLNDGNPLKKDIAIHCAHSFLPEMENYCAEYQIKKSDESQIENIDSNLNDADFQYLHAKINLQEIVTSSKVGSVTTSIIILLIGTILTILSFFWYSTKIKNRYIDDVLYKCDFIRSINDALYNLGHLANFAAFHPLIISGALKLCDPSNFNDPGCTQLMTYISPILYPLGKLNPWIYDEAYSSKIIANIRENLLDIEFSLGNLSHSKGCRKLYNDLFVKTFNGELTPIKALLKCSIDIASILNSRNFDEYINSDLIRDLDRQIDLASDELLTYPQKMLDVSFDETEEIRVGLNTYWLLTLLAAIIFVAFPFNMIYYLLRIESDMVIHAFTLLPNSVIREIIQNFHEKNNNNKSGTSNNSQTFIMTHDDTSKADAIKMYVLLFISMAMIVVCCIYLYYVSFDYSDELNITLQKVTSYQESGYYTFFIFYRILRASSFNLLPPIVNISKEVLGNLTTYDQNFQLTVAQKGLNGLQTCVDQRLWGSHGAMNSYYRAKVDIDYFTDAIPEFSDESITSGKLTIFEELATVNVTNQFDLIVKDFHLLVTEALGDPDLDFLSNKYFLSLGYYANSFAGEYRFTNFFNSIDETTKHDTISKNSKIKGLIVGVAIVQVISFISITIYLCLKSNIIKKSLWMLLFLKPQAILHAHNVMNLLTKRSMKNFEDESSYLDAEKVIENTNEVALIMDKKLIISDVNNAFLKCFDEPKEQVIGKSITYVFKEMPDHNSTQAILAKLNEVFKGNISPTFREKISFLTPKGVEKNAFINVICLTSNGTAHDSNFNEICGVAFIIDDQTDQKLHEAKILVEKEKITQMLNKVLPKPIIEELQKGSNSIALSVQSASVGCIQVYSAKSFDPNDFNAPFNFLSNVYDILDEMIKDFPQLTKIKTNAFTYEYAGGIFSWLNKPEKHAEEATRFAVKVIASAREICEKVGVDVEFKIGLSTSGPLVAGVIGINKPQFHLIGPTVDLAQRMKIHGVLNQVQITRAVYELIYAYNFHVTERGDIDTGGGKILRTYVVNP